MNEPEIKCGQRRVEEGTGEYKENLEMSKKNMTSDDSTFLVLHE